MNDFSEIENELKKLRPARPSEDLAARIECALAETDRSAITAAIVTKPRRFHLNWLSLGLGLAAATAFLIFARINIDRTPAQTNRVAQNTPAPSTSAVSSFIPTGATQVVLPHPRRRFALRRGIRRANAPDALSEARHLAVAQSEHGRVPASFLSERGSRAHSCFRPMKIFDASPARTLNQQNHEN